MGNSEHTLFLIVTFAFFMFTFLLVVAGISNAEEDKLLSKTLLVSMLLILGSKSSNQIYPISYPMRVLKFQQQQKNFFSGIFVSPFCLPLLLLCQCGSSHKCCELLRVFPHIGFRSKNCSFCKQSVFNLLSTQQSMIESTCCILSLRF